MKKNKMIKDSKMEKNKRIEEMKETLVEIYANNCIQALKIQGVHIADGGKFYDKLSDLISDSILFGDIL